MKDFIEQWVRKAQEFVASHHDRSDRNHYATEIAALIKQAKEQAQGLPEGPKALSEVSGQLRMDLTAARSEEDRETLSALALAFSRASGELAGSPT
jgi:hypothetical protein